MDNDYMGMAQDIKAMRKRARIGCENLSIITYQFWLEALKEFEQYCLDQPATLDVSEE